MTRCVGFPPVARPDARVLILGTMPGEESLRRRQYYARRTNAFWPIMGELFGADPELAYDQRLEALQNAGVAIWDVCETAWRPGSLDVNLKDVQPNDFAAFFAAHRGIDTICFNGKSAAKLFDRNVAPSLAEEIRGLPRIALPSTSPAHTVSFDEKLALWRAALRPRLPSGLSLAPAPKRGS